MEKMHVVAAFVSNAEAKISGAWHKCLYNERLLPSILRARLRTAINAIPAENLSEQGFSVLQHFSEHRVRSQIEKSTANMRHD
ncbi:MAG: hypothetical protein Udaeo2_11470 [Candidatus Udaeobacter sp.]|nr:MAG: hypothetical protein Udaeo2_11470 [Candidatus Udaeobacter sp.]